MKRTFLLAAAVILMSVQYASAQYKDGAAAPEEGPLVLTLDKALEIALSENTSVKVADKEVERVGYAKKGAYAALFPQIDASASYQRTIKKQVMYMDFNAGALGGGAGAGAGSDSGSGSGSGSSSSSGGGIEMGRYNTYSAGVTAALPLVNAQLWKSIEISGQDVELAVEKARASRLDMVSQVKQAYYAVLLARQSKEVYKQVYDNAVANFKLTEQKYNVQKASELDLARAKTSVANAMPNFYDAVDKEYLALWQLKAVMGVDLDMDIDVAGSLGDYAGTMFRDIHANDGADLSDNTTMRQLAIQAEELANAVKLQKYAALPSLSLGFSYSMSAMANDYKFSEYKWTPYSYVGLSLSIPIFAGGKRYHAIKQAEVQATELDIQRTATERQLKIAIRQYLNTMDTQMKTYDAANSALETAQKAYDIARKSYEVGRSTLTDLNDAQLALTQTQLSASMAIYSFLVAKTGLENTLGNDFIEK